MLNFKQTLIASMLLQGAALQAEVRQATIKEVRSASCPDHKWETEAEGKTTVWLNRKGGHEAFCNVLVKIQVPKGYSLQPDLKAALTVGANLLDSDDKLYMILKVQLANQVDSTTRSIALNTDRPSPSQVTLSGDADMPQMGNCEKDRQGTIGFASTAKIIRAGVGTDAADAAATPIKLEIPALQLVKLDCPEPTPTSLPTPAAH